MDIATFIPLFVFVAGIADVSVGTSRTILVVAGMRWQAALLATVQITIFVLAIGGVLSRIENPLAIVGLAAGWGVGTLLGMWLEERIALGYRVVQVMNADQTVCVSEALRERGFRVTQVEGLGLSGPVEVAMTVIRRRALNEVREAIAEIAPAAFVTVERADRPLGGAFTQGSRFSRWPWTRGRAALG